MIRHAETECSLTGRHTGRSDIPLTDRGRTAATALAVRLTAEHFTSVLVSPSRRARQTCDLCGLGERAEIREDLLEWDYGAYEGLTTPQIRERRADWNLWRDGCPEGESAADVGRRADRVIAELDRLDGVVAIVSHGHALRVLGARWIDLAPEQGARLGLATGAICRLGYERSTRVLAGWNESAAPPRATAP